MIKTRLVLSVLAVPLILVVLAGCGSSGDSGSSADPAAVAPPNSPVFVEAKLRPSGSLKANIEELASRVAGINDVGAKIVAEIEKSARDSGEPFDYEKDVEPWLGEDASVFLSRFNGNDFEGNGVAVEVTDTGEAQDFLDQRVKTDSGTPPKDESYEGVEYKVDSEDELGGAVGLVGDFIVFGSDQKAFKEAVDASKGESLADVADYKGIVSAAPEGSLADVYVDIGRLIEESDNVDPNTLGFFESLGLELSEATALASLVPGTDQVEIDVASGFGGAEGAPPASDLLGTMPADSVIALAGSDFGKSIGKAIDQLDQEGIPGQVPPDQLKSALKRVGIDIDRITGSLEGIAAFAEGTDKSNLAGAVVLTTDDPTGAADTVSSVGLLLRANHTPGVTAVTGKATGFSVRSPALGEKPLVVAAKGKRIAIGYGLPATIRGLTSESGPTLSGTATYREAVSALGGAQISGFVDGAAAVKVAGALVDREDRAKFAEAMPYLSKIGYIAIGSDSEGGRSVARLIVGLAK